MLIVDARKATTLKKEDLDTVLSVYESLINPQALYKKRQKRIKQMNDKEKLKILRNRVKKSKKGTGKSPKSNKGKSPKSNKGKSPKTNKKTGKSPKSNKKTGKSPKNRQSPKKGPSPKKKSGYSKSVLRFVNNLKQRSRKGRSSK